MTIADADRDSDAVWARRIGRAALAAGAVAAYVLGDLLLLPFALPPSRLLPFYLSAGLAFALLLVGGRRWIPVLFTGRLIVLLLPWWPHLSLPWTIASAAIHTAVYAVGAAVVARRVVVIRPAWRVQDVIWLMLGMYASAMVQAVSSIGVARWAAGTLAHDWWRDVIRFAAGDAVGMLMVVPMVLFVFRPLIRGSQRTAGEIDVYMGSPDSPVSPGTAWPRRLEPALQTVAVLTALAVALTTRSQGVDLARGALVVLVLPLAWVAVRGGLMGSALVIAAYGVGGLSLARLLPNPALQVTLFQWDLLALGAIGLLLAAARSASHESAARYWQLVATAAEGIWRLDRDGKTLSVSPRMAVILGRDERDILGRNAGDFIAPEDIVHWQARRHERADGRESTYEVRLARADGTRVWVLVNASPVRSVTTGENVGAIAVVTDVTAMREAETQRRHAQLLLEAAFHSSQDAMELHRVSDNVIIDVNAIWCEVTGHAKDEAVGRPITELGIWGDPADAARLDEVVREHGYARNFEVAFNRRRTDARTERGYALLAAHPIQLDDVTYMLVTGRDISVEKRAAEAQRQVKRMEELGRLAGGVAHDFNNLLTVIGAYAEMAQASIARGHPVELFDLSEIKAAADRGHELTRRLLAFSRHQPPEVRALELEPVLRHAAGMLRALLPPGTRLRMELGGHLPPIMADASQVDQVLLNLCVNARDAMPDGGDFVLRTSTIKVADSQAAALVGPGALPGEYVVLTATDTGVGIDAETLPRIFEPFFTTKAASEGTGLGLAVIYGIVRQARGAVRVTSEPGKGATFTIFWPAAPFAPVPSERARMPVPRHRNPGGHVLLLEDEAIVRRITRRVLEGAGFEVSSASDGGRGLECLEELKADGRAPDVIVTDISMPGLSGRDVAARVLLSDPGLPVVLVSAYDEPAGSVAPLANVPFPVVMKPYEVANLVAVVRAAMEWRHDGAAANHGA